jgi:hypothetical protein
VFFKSPWRCPVALKKKRPSSFSGTPLSSLPPTLFVEQFPGFPPLKRKKASDLAGGRLRLFRAQHILVSRLL